MTTPENVRATQLDVDEVRRLDHFATSLDVMFPTNVGIVHVGSSLTNPSYRDVDVRIIMPDSDLRKLAKRVNLLDLNMLLSGWGRRTTDLRIDCQVQSLSESNSEGNRALERQGVRAMARRRRPLDEAIR